MFYRGPAEECKRRLPPRYARSETRSRIADLMDGITELRTQYRTSWLREHTPYRLGTALGRWDAEYEYWRGLQARFVAFDRQYKAGEPLPPLESIVKAH